MQIRKVISNFALGFTAGVIFIAVLLCNNTGLSLVDSLCDEVISQASDWKDIERHITASETTTSCHLSFKIQKQIFRFRIKGKSEKVRFDCAVFYKTAKPVRFAKPEKLLPREEFDNSFLTGDHHFRGPPSFLFC